MNGTSENCGISSNELACNNGDPREKGENEIERMLEEIMAPNFPQIDENSAVHIQEVSVFSSRITSKKPTAGHITVKLLEAKNKERILKAAREKQFIT